MSLKKLGCKLLNYFLAWKVYKPSQRTSSSAVLVWHLRPSRISGLWSVSNLMWWLQSTSPMWTTQTKFNCLKGSTWLPKKISNGKSSNFWQKVRICLTWWQKKTQITSNKQFSRMLGLCLVGWATWMQEAQSKLMTALLQTIRPWCSSSCRVCRNKTGQVSNYNDRQIPMHSYANNKNESMRGRRKKIRWVRWRKKKRKIRSERLNKRNKGLSALNKKGLKKSKLKGLRLSVKSLN